MLQIVNLMPRNLSMQTDSGKTFRLLTNETKPISRQELSDEMRKKAKKGWIQIVEPVETDGVGKVKKSATEGKTEEGKG